jgi:hypothetical protein
MEEAVTYIQSGGCDVHPEWVMPPDVSCTSRLRGKFMI